MKLWSRAEISPVESATAALEQALAKRDRITGQLTQTRAELARIRQQAADAALAERSSEVSEISGEVAQCAATADALSAALAVADAELQLAEATLAREQDLELRAESTRTIAGIIEAINVTAPAIAVGVEDMIVVLRRAASFNLDSRQVLGVFEALQSDLSVLINTSTGALAHHSVLVENGSAPARLPAPEAQPVARSAPPETTSVCLLFDSRWIDPVSKLERFAGKGWDCGLVPALASRAIAVGVAVPSDSTKAKALRIERGSPVPNSDALDLDSPSLAPPPPPAERWGRPFADPTWQLPTPTGAPRPWINKAST